MAETPDPSRIRIFYFLFSTALTHHLEAQLGRPVLIHGRQDALDAQGLDDVLAPESFHQL